MGMRWASGARRSEAAVVVEVGVSSKFLLRGCLLSLKTEEG